MRLARPGLGTLQTAVAADQLLAVGGAGGRDYLDVELRDGPLQRAGERLGWCFRWAVWVVSVFRAFAAYLLAVQFGRDGPL